MEVPLVARLLGAQDAEPAVADEHGVVHAQDVRITRSDPRDLKQFGEEGAINWERLCRSKPGRVCAQLDYLRAGYASLGSIHGVERVGGTKLCI